jgi:competence protein ComEC
VLPALLAALGYAALAGFSLPTQRALLMTAVAMWLLVSSRPRSAWHNLLLVALLVTVPAPLAWLDSSFWLSFGAVTLLVFAHSAGQSGLIRLQLTLTLVFGLLAGQLFAWWSLSALPANLVLVPVYSLLLVPLALLGALLDNLLLLDMAARLVDYSWRWLLWLAPWPSLPLPTSWLATALLALLLLRWLLPALPGPRWLLLACLLPWLWPQDQRPLRGDVELVVFDVGQGLMTALRTHSHLLLFDLGPSWQDADAASRVLTPWLRKRRLQPDLVFISHRHLDHAGGAGLFSDDAYRGRVFAGEPDALAAGLPDSHACLRGQRWRFDEVAIEVLWPPAEMPLLHSNNRSCVVKVVANNQSILLTGDIGRQVEYWLAQQDDLRADVLQVPHHGSRSSSSFAFLRAVAPSHAFVSAGYRNSFGHPDAAIMARYQQAGIDVAVSANSGMLVYGRRDRAEKGLQPLRWRQHAPFPWRLSEPVVE